MDNVITGSSASSNHGELIATARRQHEAARRRSAARPVSSLLSLQPFTLLPGYEIGPEIHRGGQGVVYRAVQRSTGRTVAIKVMREGPFAGPRDRARFEREVHILGRLNHPNIV